MKYIKPFKTFPNLFESTIGIDNIYNKYYSDLPKSIFYKIINIDPTSIRKKDFSKPGKYSKWLLREYRKLLSESRGRDVNEFQLNERLVKTLNYYLFIVSSGWFKNECKEFDIFKYTIVQPSERIKDFIYFMGEYISLFEAQTVKAKYDVVYSDNNVSILVPLNFTASYETAKNTDWCSKDLYGFSAWKQKSIMFRIMPKNKEYDKLKLTWSFRKKTWYLACSKYPEITGEDSPFDIVDGRFRYENRLALQDGYNKGNVVWEDNSHNIKKTMEIVSDKAKHFIEGYYKHINDNI